MNWYVGTDWSVIPAGGNSLRQVFVKLEDCEALEAALETSRFDRDTCDYHILKQDRRIAELEAIIARNDTTESFKCTECGAWHVRKVEAK